MINQNKKSRRSGIGSSYTRTVCVMAVLAAVALTATGAEENDPGATDGAMPLDRVIERMETAVPSSAWDAYRKEHPAPFWLFGEDRRFAVRNDIIPAHWFNDGAAAAQCFRGVAQPGEFYPFQVCVASVEAREVEWTAETELKVERITPQRCAVRSNGVKPIWVMVDVPKNAAGKTFKGRVVVTDAASSACASLPFEIKVSGDVLEDGGVRDGWRLSRLKWLNSEIGREGTVTKPYTPVVVDRARRTVKILGRELVLGEDGLPARIVSHFNGSNTRIVEKGADLLAAPMRFKSCCRALAASSGGETAIVQRQKFAFTEISPACAAWRAEAALDGGVTRIVEGRMDFTGSGFFRIRHEGAASASAALEIRMPADMARFREGLGANGGFFDGKRVEHVWNPKFNRDIVWLGSVNGGLAVRFRGANYTRPLVNVYYAWRALRMPESWAAGGGKIVLEKDGREAVVHAGGEGAPAGAEWNFELYLTPFRMIDMRSHLAERYHHLKLRTGAFDASTVRKAGANVVVAHHNTLWNPYINYPYNDDGGPLLKKAVAEAHGEGLAFKVYYTTRELTQNMPEFFALKSLDGEILLKRDASVPGWPSTNRSGPKPWLRQHVGLDILPAWRTDVRFSAYPNRSDLSVITTPDGRWDNFYLAGLDFLVREYGIDGIYLDDTALTGEAMQRARRILDRDGKRRLVDQHSWNHHDARAGAGSSNLVYIDLYPYFDSLWRGEGFYNGAPPDFWLVERSGLAFGLTSEMLGRGNPFRGLLFGMTGRHGVNGETEGLWRFFDEMRLGDMEFSGWWDDACPVKVVGAPEVLASVWKGKDSAVLVVANFSKDKRTVSFSFDASRLGFDGTKAVWSRPQIDGVQTASPAPDFSSPVEIPGGKGMILVSRLQAL